MNKFNIGDKVWFKLDSYGRKAEMHGTIRDSINVGDGWCYNIETSDHKHWNIKEKDINYSAPHTRDYNREDEKYYAIGMPVRYSWGGPDPDNIRTGMIVENSEYRRGFYVIKDDRNGEKYNISANRILGYNTTDISSEEERVCRTCKNRKCGLAYDPCVICKDHNMWESTNANQYTGGYIYPVGAHVRFKYHGKELIGNIQERYQDYVSKKYEYRINVDDKFYIIKPDSILGYAVNWIDYPSIRKAFGVDVKNDIYENIKKQINKDQLNFHYGLSSIFKLAPNDAAVPFELSEDRKEYIRNDVAATMSYLHELHKNGFYGLNTDSTIYVKNGKSIDIKEDNKMKKEQKKRNRNIIKVEKYQRTIKDISFNGPAVIVKFEPSDEDLAWGRFKGDKVVVVCKDDDKYDMKTGFLLAILKEFLNNQSYGNILEKLDSFDTFDIPQVGKEDNKIEKKCEDDWKFMVGDLVRLKSGNIIFKVVRTLTWNYNGKVIHRYAIQRFGGSRYTTYENENRLTLVEPTTGRLTKSMIKE